MPPQVVLGTASSSITLTPEQPVAVADVLVTRGAGSDTTPAIVAVRSDTYPIRITSRADGDAQPQFVGDQYSPAYRIGVLDSADDAFHRHVLVWLTDPAALPADVTLTVDAVSEPRAPVPSALAGTAAVIASWTAGDAPSVVSRVVSGELPLAKGDAVTATLDLQFDPGAVEDPTSLVTTWWVDATFVPTDPNTASTANLTVHPATSGSSVTLFSPGFRTIYQPDTITCTWTEPCRLHYDLGFQGSEGKGVVRWQVTAQIVDFAGPAPAARSVSIGVDVVPSTDQPLGR